MLPKMQRSTIRVSSTFLLKSLQEQAGQGALQHFMPVRSRLHHLPGSRHTALTPLALAPRDCSSCEPISVATSVLAVMMSEAPAVRSSAACRESRARAKMGVSLKCSRSVRTADTLHPPQRHPSGPCREGSSEDASTSCEAGSEA